MTAYHVKPRRLRDCLSPVASGSHRCCDGVSKSDVLLTLIVLMHFQQHVIGTEITRDCADCSWIVCIDALLYQN